MTMPIPNLSFASPENLQSGANGNGFDSLFTVPFAFDNSGWNVSIKSSGNQSAQGSTGQAAGAGRGGSLADMFAGIDPKWLLLVAGVYLLVRKKG